MNPPTSTRLMSNHFILGERLKRRMPLCVAGLAACCAVLCQGHWLYVGLTLMAGGLSWLYMLSLSGTALRPAGKYQGVFSILRMGLMGWCVASIWRLWLKPGPTLLPYLLPPGLQQNILAGIVIAAFFSYKLSMLPEFWTQGWLPGLQMLRSGFRKAGKSPE